jgi:hypothetical protein
MSLYEALEQAANAHTLSDEEFSKQVHAFVRVVLPGHIDTCPLCQQAITVEAIVECLLEEELLAPFLDWRYTIPASLAQVVLDWIEEQRG